MGYYAQGEGHLTIPEADQEDCFLAAMTALADYNYDQQDAEDLTELLGTVFEAHPNVDGDQFWLTYSEKYVDGWLFRFLQALAPFVTEGVIDWRGESGDLWRHRFHDGDVVFVDAVVTYVNDPVS